ncbi:MAG: DUF1679 domain-containing protein [Deltaproteobacteria bacterium]|nr:DUF1679 domain-containing protein [Deltaproteobacteria bacterium]
MNLSLSKTNTNVLPPPPPADVAKALKVAAVNIDWLAGDGSDRCYYRITGPELTVPLVLMQLSGSDAQALKDGGYDWINIANLLSLHKIFVPHVSCTMPDHAALIIEDYGDQMLEGSVFTLWEKHDLASLRQLYLGCMEIITKFLSVEKNPDSVWCQRGFDTERFVWELKFFLQKYAFPIAGISFSKMEEAQFQKEATSLAELLSSGSKYFVHRDFHSRNVMVKETKLAVIDFQDARLGPASYDLVSLCFDSYVPFSSEMRTELMNTGLNVIRQQLGDSIYQDANEFWRPMLLQRQLKAIGSFGYLTVDKKRHNYLKYVGPALNTLETQNIADQRWPLLSDTLIRRMRISLDKNFYGK